MPVIETDEDSLVLQAQQIVTYRIRFADDLLDSGPDERDLWCVKRTASSRRLVFVSDSIDRLYGQRLRACFTRHGLQCEIVTVPSGERTKTDRWLTRSLRLLDRYDPMRRDEPVIIIGTGVAIDREGMAAALIRRGVPVIVVAVDGIGAWDAAVGWKRGIDFGGKKNRLGAYWPPAEVYICREFFRTEPPRVRASSAVESIKYALVEDAELFALWEKHGATVLAEAYQGVTDDGDMAARAIIRRSASGMGSHITENALEVDLYKSTLIGHTLSQVLEMAAMRWWWRRFLLPGRIRSDDLLHGEAVALDILVTGCIAHRRGLLTDGEFERVVNIFDSIGVPIWNPLLANRRLISAGLAEATRHRNGRVRLPLPDGIGKCAFADDVSTAQVMQAIADTYDLAQRRHGLTSAHQRQRRPGRLGPVGHGLARSGPLTLVRRFAGSNPLGEPPPDGAALPASQRI